MKSSTITLIKEMFVNIMYQKVFKKVSVKVVVKAVAQKYDQIDTLDFLKDAYAHKECDAKSQTSRPLN